jgi:hypothetical protein
VRTMERVAFGMPRCAVRNESGHKLYSRRMRGIVHRVANLLVCDVSGWRQRWEIAGSRYWRRNLGMKPSVSLPFCLSLGIRSMELSLRSFRLAPVCNGRSQRCKCCWLLIRRGQAEHTVTCTAEEQLAMITHRTFYLDNLPALCSKVHHLRSPWPLMA